MVLVADHHRRGFLPCLTLTCAQARHQPRSTSTRHSLPHLPMMQGRWHVLALRFRALLLTTQLYVLHLLRSLAYNNFSTRT